MDLHREKPAKTNTNTQTEEYEVKVGQKERITVCGKLDENDIHW